MPVRTGRDGLNCFAQWGTEGKKYYYPCGDDRARAEARRKAERQGRAIKAKKPPE